MNKKNALKILGLKKGASLPEAKKAYRCLAKQYHPDRFAPDRFALDDIAMDDIAMDDIGSTQAEARMKLINQAFHFLVPLLPPIASIRMEKKDTFSDNKSPENTHVSNAQKIHKKTGFSFTEFIKIFKKGFESKANKKSSFKKNPRIKEHPFLKKQAQQKKVSGQTARFDKILKIHYPGLPFVGKFKEGRADLLKSKAKANPYANFQRHMALKKQINSRTRMHDELNCGRVEKIQPLPGVNSIGEE